jgi:hypothetical protein
MRLEFGEKGKFLPQDHAVQAIQTETISGSLSQCSDWLQRSVSSRRKARSVLQRSVQWVQATVYEGEVFHMSLSSAALKNTQGCTFTPPDRYLGA